MTDADARLLDSSMEAGGAPNSTPPDSARSIQQGGRPLMMSNALEGAENRLVAIAEVPALPTHIFTHRVHPQPQ